MCFCNHADGLVPVLGISRAEDHVNLIKSMFQIQTQVAMAIGDDEIDSGMVNMTWLTDASQQQQGQRSEWLRAFIQKLVLLCMSFARYHSKMHGRLALQEWVSVGCHTPVNAFKYICTLST
jgi:hypothetical protein